MKNTDKKYLAGSLAFLVLAVIAVFLYMRAGHGMAEATALEKVIREMTASYRLRQIAATVILYGVGYLAAYPFCSGIGTDWAGVLAMPVGNALWGVASALLLFLNIPYNRWTMCAVGGLLLGALFFRFRESYRGMDWIGWAAWHTAALAVTIMAASGVFARFLSSDSYYFVMQYGELIAKEGRLSSDIVGTYMTWTGLTPALTSSFAAMWGFENIYAIHYLLVFGMYGFLMKLGYRGASAYWGRKGSFLIGLAAVLTVGIIPGVAYLSFWIINNTYFMVYIVIMGMLPVLEGRKPGGRTVCLMGLIGAWLTLCRTETALVMCFFLVCASVLELPRRQMAALYGPVCAAQLLFFGKLGYEYAIGARQAGEKMLTLRTGAVLVLALALTGAYIGLYRLGWVGFLRRHLRAFVLWGLLLSCLGLGLLDMDKFQNNLDVCLHHFSDWYWKYVPLTILVLEVLKTCYRCRDSYYDLIVWGFLLCNFAVCMGRPHGLRLGIGDSYNRICLSIMPLYVASTVLTFVEYFGRDRTVTGGKAVPGGRAWKARPGWERREETGEKDA